MKLHELQPALQVLMEVHNRVGRGTSSSNGKTSGRGPKGQKLVAVAVFVLVFEGGLDSIVPSCTKTWFLERKPQEYAIVNLDQLNVFEDGASNSSGSHRSRYCKKLKNLVLRFLATEN